VALKNEQINRTEFANPEAACCTKSVGRVWCWQVPESKHTNLISDLLTLPGRAREAGLTGW
jgi:hypothetical protein